MSIQQTTSARKRASGPGRTFSKSALLLAVVIIAGCFVFPHDQVDWNRFFHLRPSESAKTSVSPRDASPAIKMAVPAIQAMPPPSRSGTDPPAVIRQQSPDPSLSLDLPDVAHRGVSQPPARPIIDIPHATSPELVQPAPGCPLKVRSVADARLACQSSEKSDCIKRDGCHWSGTSTCAPKSGTYSAYAARHAIAGQEIDVAEPPLNAATARLIAKADGYLARGQTGRAIEIYTDILDDDQFSAVALNQRAIAFENIGKKDRALIDYCKLLITETSSLGRMENALARIAVLVRPEIVPPARQPADQASLPIPPTGDLISRQNSGGAPFKIMTQRGSNYLLKLTNVRNTKDRRLIFVKGGETYATTVPLGTYTLKIAGGDTWFGGDDLFGPRTTFFRLRAKPGAADPSDETLKFTRTVERTTTRRGILTTTRFNGMTIDLQGSAAGNMEQETISRRDFDSE